MTKTLIPQKKIHRIQTVAEMKTTNKLNEPVDQKVPHVENVVIKKVENFTEIMSPRQITE